MTFTLSFATTSYATREVTIQTKKDGWADIGGRYQGDAWLFDLDETLYPDGIAFRFALDRKTPMDNAPYYFVGRPYAAFRQQFAEKDVHFPAQPVAEPPAVEAVLAAADGAPPATPLGDGAAPAPVPAVAGAQLAGNPPAAGEVNPAVPPPSSPEPPYGGAVPQDPATGVPVDAGAQGPLAGLVSLLPSQTEQSLRGAFIALLSPMFAIISGAVAGWVAKNLPGLNLDQTQVTSFMVLVAATAFGAAWKWLTGWQQHENLVAQGRALPVRPGKDPHVT